jgi:hypothetical protein
MEVERGRRDEPKTIGIRRSRISFLLTVPIAVVLGLMAHVLHRKGV